MTGSRVLLVEAQSALRTVYSKALTSSGYRVDAVKTCDEARMLLSAQQYVVILCSINQGQHAELQQLQEHYTQLVAQGMHIILMSDSLEDRAVCEALGYDFFLTRPMSLSLLVAKVQGGIRHTLELAGD
jgi:DNA-binding response OmpR family regulator